MSGLNMDMGDDDGQRPDGDGQRPDGDKLHDDGEGEGEGKDVLIEF